MVSPVSDEQRRTVFPSKLPSKRKVPTPAALWILTAVVLTFALYVSQTFIVPVLVGVLLSYALSPIVDSLVRRRVPRSLAALLVVAFVIGASVGLAYDLSDEAATALRNIPILAQRFRNVAQEAMRGQPNVVSELQEAADAVAEATDTSPQPRRRPGEPMPVEIVEPPIDVQQYVWDWWRGMLSLSGQAILVAFLTFFMLSSGDLYRRKVVKLAGQRLSDRRVTVEILDEIGNQISRFLLHVLITSVLVGVATWLVFLWLGVQYAALWGIAAGVMNSIPYFGPTVVAIAAFVISFLQFGSIWQAGLVGFASLVITTIEGMLVTPLLVSRLSRMNPVAVFVGLLFWGWLWGIVGMLLAVPLMMTFKTIAGRVEDLQPINELLGD